MLRPGSGKVLAACTAARPQLVQRRAVGFDLRFWEVNIVPRGSFLAGLCGVVCIKLIGVVVRMLCLVERESARERSAPRIKPKKCSSPLVYIRIGRR